jgi:hypothetical protein
MAEHIPQIIESLVNRAASGDAAAARLILERVIPPLKAVEAPQCVSLPATGLADQGRAAIDSVAAGELAVSQGAALLSAIGTLARVMEVDELVRRVEMLEQQHVRS